MEEFKFRDRVWMMIDNKPKEVVICKTVTTQYDDDRGIPSTTIYLYARTDYYTTPFEVDVTQIFKTKTDLINSL